MPTTYGTKTKKKDIRKRAEKLNMDRVVELAREKHDDGTFLSHQEIADNMGCSRVAVTRALQRVPEWVLKDRDVEVYKRDRADILAAAQQTILQHITPDKLKIASLQQLGTLFGIFYDKERLDRGHATANIAVISEHKLDEETRKLIYKAIETRTQALLNKSKVKNTAETESGSDDSDASGVSD